MRKTRRFRSAWVPLIAFGIACCATHALAGTLSPVDLRIAGSPAVLSTPALSDGSETWAPVDILPSVGLRATEDRNADALEAVCTATGERVELALTRLHGTSMVSLNDLASAVGAQVVTPREHSAASATTGRAVVLLMAKVTSIRFDGTELRIHTSLPVHSRALTVADPAPRRGVVDCIGLWIGDKWLPPASSVNLRGGQFNAETARFVVPLTARGTVQVMDARASSADITAHFDSAPAIPVQSPAVIAPQGPTATQPRGATGVTPTPPGPVAQPGMTVVTGTDVAPSGPDTVQVTLKTSRRAISYVRYLNGGRDLVVDFENATLAPGPPDAYAHHYDDGLVRSVAAEPVPGARPGVRVTLGMERVAGFTVTVADDATTIEIRVPMNATGSLAGKLVVVDPGHGGTSSGALGHGPVTVYEKNVTLAISLKLRAALEAAGARVVMTRDRDVNVDLYARPKLANDIHADFFISIHNDSNGRDNSATGTTTYYHMGDSSSHALAEAVQDSVKMVTGLHSKGALSDGVLYHSGLAVLRASKMPAVLVEVAYINNDVDRARLVDPDFQERVANAIVAGLKSYVGGANRIALGTATESAWSGGSEHGR